MHLRWLCCSVRLLDLHDEIQVERISIDSIYRVQLLVQCSRVLLTNLAELGRTLWRHLLHFEGLVVQGRCGDGNEVGKLNELVWTTCLVLVASRLVVSIEAI